MATNLDALSLVQLTAHYNALPGVTPVKKFPSKATALDRIAKAAPAKAKKPAAPRSKVTVIGAGEAVLDSRRTPTSDTAERVRSLVAKFGGKGEVSVTDAAAALGVEADEIRRRVKRLRSWFGKDAVTRKGGAIVIHVRK